MAKGEHWVSSKSGMMHEIHLCSYLSPKLESTSSLHCLLLDEYKSYFFMFLNCVFFKFSKSRLSPLPLLAIVNHFNFSVNHRCSYDCHLKRSKRKAWKIQAWTGPINPVQCITSWVIRPTGSWLLYGATISPLIVDIYVCVMYLNCNFSVKDPYSYEYYLSNSERKKNTHIYTRISYIEIVAIHNNYYFTYVLVLSFANRTLP